MANRDSHRKTYPRFAIVMLLAMIIDQVAAAGLTEKDLYAKKQECYADIDSGLWGLLCTRSSIAKENCALRCVSQACYNLIYANDPLEEGEVDTRRGREFKYCVRREARGDDVSVKMSYE